MLYIIIWNDNNDKTVSRLYTSYPIQYEVGIINGYGWQVITIQELYETSFYKMETILSMIKEESIKKEIMNSRIKKIIQFVDLLLS